MEVISSEELDYVIAMNNLGFDVIKLICFYCKREYGGYIPTKVRRQEPSMCYDCLRESEESMKSWWPVFFQWKGYEWKN